MINKFKIRDLRNAEYFQFVSSAYEIFVRYGVDRPNLDPLYEEARECLSDAELALAAEKKNAKVREKNEMDSRRDNLHSKLFNYVKFITYDDKDARFDDAQTVMRVLKEVGNPTRLAENAESAMLTSLGNRLEPYRKQMEAIGAQQILDELMEANRLFIALEIECRGVTAAKGPSMSAVRKRTDAVYRSIIDVINSYTRIPAKRGECTDMITDMNVLVAKYDQLLMTRKTKNAAATGSNDDENSEE